MNADAGVTLGVIENSDGTRSAAYGGLEDLRLGVVLPGLRGEDRHPPR